MKTLRVCAYTRVSTSKDDQKNSLINQQSFFNRYISKNPDYVFVDIYSDPGLTGTKLNNRPMFINMLKDAGLDVVKVFNDDKDKRKGKHKDSYIASSSRESKFDLILIKSTSRFARNIEVVQIIRELIKKNVHIHFLDRDLCTANEKDREYIEQMLLDDQKESSTKSRLVRWGLEESAERGLIHTNQKLYGYSYNKEENSLTPIEEESKVVKLIFELYANNKGLRRIRNHLDENGYKTRNGKSFGNSTLSRILSNEKYAGYNNRNKYDTGELFNKNSYPKVKPKDEYKVTATEKIPALVSKGLFDTCQTIREKNSCHINQKGKYNGHTDYAGLIKCGICGSSYISNSENYNTKKDGFKKRKFYNCSTKKKHGTGKCSNSNISLHHIEEKLAYECKVGYKEHLMLTSSSNLTIFLELLDYLKKELNTDKTKLLNKSKVKLDEIKIKIQDLTKMRLAGEIDLDDFEPIKKEYQNEKEHLTSIIQEYSKENDELLKDIQEVKEIIAEIADIEEKVKIKYSKDDLLQEIAQITCKDGDLIISYKITDTAKQIAEKYKFPETFFEYINELAERLEESAEFE